MTQKTLPEDGEFRKEVSDYISNITDEAKLSEIYRAVRDGAKMGKLRLKWNEVINGNT